MGSDRVAGSGADVGRGPGFQVVVDLPKKMKLALDDDDDEGSEREWVAEKFEGDMQGVVRSMTEAIFKDEIEMGRKLAREAIEKIELSRAGQGLLRYAV